MLITCIHWLYSTIWGLLAVTSSFLSPNSASSLNTDHFKPSSFPQSMHKSGVLMLVWPRSPTTAMYDGWNHKETIKINKDIWDIPVSPISQGWEGYPYIEGILSWDKVYPWELYPYPKHMTLKQEKIIPHPYPLIPWIPLLLAEKMMKHSNILIWHHLFRYFSHTVDCSLQNRCLYTLSNVSYVTWTCIWRIRELGLRIGMIKDKWE